MNNYEECDICRGPHNTRMHGVPEMTAWDFFTKHYRKEVGTIAEICDFADDFAKLKQNGIDQTAPTPFVSHEGRV